MLLYQPPPQQQEHEQQVVQMNSEALKNTDMFTYLGSTVTIEILSDVEINRRIQAACKAFGSFQHRLWSRHDIKLCTKIKVYNAAVLPSLLYSTEIMILIPQAHQAADSSPTPTLTPDHEHQVARQSSRCGCPGTGRCCECGSPDNCSSALLGRTCFPHVC